jgi:hypothetical protein
VTRRSKTTRRRHLALRVVPYLRAILCASPDRYRVVSVVTQEGPHWTTQERLIVCWYGRALSVNAAPHSLMLRIREQIVYPTTWLKYPLSLRDIQQRATLASWWCKSDKD